MGSGGWDQIEQADQIYRVASYGVFLLTEDMADRDAVCFEQKERTNINVFKLKLIIQCLIILSSIYFSKAEVIYRENVGCIFIGSVDLLKIYNLVDIPPTFLQLSTLFAMIDRNRSSPSICRHTSFSRCFPPSCDVKYSKFGCTQIIFKTLAKLNIKN